MNSNLLLVQETPELPPLESDPHSWQNCFVPAMHWADQFWLFCFERCHQLLLVV